MKAIKVIITCAIVLSITACGSVRPPATSYYLLTPPPLNGTTAVKPVFVQVEMAEFLTTGTLTMQQDNQHLQPAHYQRWGQPLPGMIARYVQRKLQQRNVALPGQDNLHLIFDNFHPTANGTVHISGQWWVDSIERPATVHLFDLSASQNSAGYAATVTTLRQLLNQLCSAIATALANGNK